jgi:hypothetical protein
MAKEAELRARLAQIELENAAKWTDVAIATLAFARGSADVDQWRHDNRRYLARLQKAHAAQHQRIEDAIAALALPPQPLRAVRS